jgi:outer membrane biosynthesis protein TonB
MQEYYTAKFDHLGLEATFYNIDMPSSAYEPKSISYEDAVNIGRDAVSRWGDEYLQVFDKIITKPHIDVYPSDTKRTGAYEYLRGNETTPFVLYNFNDLESYISTIVHEMGHAVYSEFAAENQNEYNNHPGIFTQEVASTANELLFYRKMVEEAPTEEAAVEEPVAEEPVSEEVPEDKEVAEEKEVPEDKAPLVEEVNYREEIPDDSDEESSSSWRWILGVLGVLLLMAACAAGGYYFGYGQGLEKGMAVIKESNDSLAAVVKADSLVAQNDSLAAKQDSISQTETPAEEVQKTEENTPASAEAKPEVPAQPKPEPKKEAPAEKKVETPAPELDPYAAKDVRVRYGGYRIVGTDHTEKIRPGDTPARIARRTLGEGMECYIEVYNGWSANQQLKEGQTVKIPKVVLKKKKRQ